jgi:hypothetical protein
MAMLLMHPVTHDVRTIEDDLEPCCVLALWSLLVDGFGYAPFDPNAKVYAARLQMVLVIKENRT